MTLNNILSTTTTNARTINLNNSTISCSGSTPVSLAATNLTFNAGTSTINCSGAAPTFAGGGQTFYNVNFTSATAAINSVSITGANTFNNLNVTTTALQKTITLGANQTINGTLTLGATNIATFRMSVVSDIVGTPRTLTVATLAALNDVDFRDIVAAGASAASPWSGTRIGNCLGNSNITFAAGATKYWNLAAGGIWNSNAWALTSGGAAAVNNFPLPQDFVIIEDTGLNVGAAINISTNADIGTLDMSTRTTAVIFQQGNTDPRFYGNVTLCSSLTIGNTTGSPTYQLVGQGLANTLNTAGVTLALSQFNVNCPTGSLTLLSNATIELTASTSGTAILSAGVFNLNGFNLTAVAFSNSNANTRTFTQGSGEIAITGNNGAVWSSSNATGLTYTTTPAVGFTYAGSTGSRTVTTNAASIISAYFNSGTDNLILASAFQDLDFQLFGGTLANSTRTIYGDLTLWSTMTTTAGALITTLSRAVAETKGLGGDGPFITIDFPITLVGEGTTILGIGLVMGSTRALTMTGGTLTVATGAATTVGSFVTTGTTAKYLNSDTPGTQATISDAGGTNTVTYLTIQDSNATGGATWIAARPTSDAGNNTGWIFPNPTGGTGGSTRFGFGFKI